MTLTEFLLARIAEDEMVAQAADWPEQSATARWQSTAHVNRHDPVRVLARCKADRQLLDLHADNGSIPGRYELRCYADDSDYPCDTLKIMALPYADHPDYHPGWKQ